MQITKSFVVCVFVLAFAYKLERCNCASNSQLSLIKWEIVIWNSPANPPLEARCKSKDDDLGAHIIDRGTQFNWDFRKNFSQTTLYWCNFESKLGHASFKVFWPEKGTWLSDRCGGEKCIWFADSKGFSLLNSLQNKFEFLHAWKPISNSQLPLTKWEVVIWNSPANPPLATHCKSKDDDLGVRIVNPGTQFNWEFRENFFRRTLFWCNFGSKLGHASFEVFWPEKGTWLSDRCGNERCIWFADSKGFSLFNIPQNKFEFIHPWEPY